MTPPDVILLGIRSALGVTFVMSAGAKLAAPTEFGTTISGLGVPRAFASRLAPILAFGELILGAVVLVGSIPIAMNLALAVATAMFAVTASVGEVRRPGAPCNCFGALTESTFGRWSTSRSMVLASLALLVLVANPPVDAASSASMVGLVLGCCILATATMLASGALAISRSSDAPG